MAAKKKGHSALLWAFISVVAFFVFAMIGSFIIALKFMLKGNLPNPDNQREFIEKMTAYYTGDMLNPITVLVIAFGGFLLVHYIISRMKPVQNGGRNLPE